MNILIKETGELRSLSFIDWHDGQEYTEQLISASGEDPNFLFDQDGEVFMTDAPTFSKWNALLQKPLRYRICMRSTWPAADFQS